MKAAINGMSMNFEVSGRESGSPVVLHHPLATDLSIWDECEQALAPTYRVVRFDARGHGRTEATPAPYALPALAHDVVALMDHLGIPRAAFVGVSMGGMVGQLLGLDHADRFSSLVLASTTSRIPAEARGMWVDRVTVARETGMRSQVEPALARWVAQATMERNPALVARLTRMIEATPVEGYAGWCNAIGALDITDRLAAIRLPTRIIVGAEDVGTPPAAAEAIQRQIAGSSLVVVPGVAHQLHVEAPGAFNAQVLDFLEQQAKEQ